MVGWLWTTQSYLVRNVEQNLIWLVTKVFTKLTEHCSQINKLYLVSKLYRLGMLAVMRLTRYNKLSAGSVSDEGANTVWAVGCGGWGGRGQGSCKRGGGWFMCRHASPVTSHRLSCERTYQYNMEIGKKISIYQQSRTLLSRTTSMHNKYWTYYLKKNQ